MGVEVDEGSDMLVFYGGALVGDDGVEGDVGGLGEGGGGGGWMEVWFGILDDVTKGREGRGAERFGVDHEAPAREADDKPLCHGGTE